MPSSDSFLNPDVIIVGAGAAGLMCGLQAARRGRRVVLLEHQDRVGKKILISGGGRCNFTNLYSKPENFLSANPHFCKSALAGFTPRDFITLVEKHDIEYFEKKSGQLFCKVSAKQMTGLLLKECEAAGVKILTSRRIDSVNRSPEGIFHVASGQDNLRAAALVIATGGLSYANLGASDFGYQIAKQFGLKVRTPEPALVPLLWNSEDLDQFGVFSGVSLRVIASCRSASFDEDLLFTHRGLSGPAILQISSYWNPGDTITLDLLPESPGDAWILEAKAAGEKSLLKNFLAQHLPKRLAEYWGERLASSRPLLQIADKELREISRQLHAWAILPSGTEGYTTAEVTRGGVDTEELSSKTMESKRIPGLYFIGEIMDVTGHLGGHNFQWAWASGYAAGRSV